MKIFLSLALVLVGVGGASEGVEDRPLLPLDAGDAGGDEGELGSSPPWPLL